MTTDLSGIAVMKPRAQPHPDRYGGLREWDGPPQGVCWHTTEGGEGLDSAEGLAAMMLRSRADTGGNFAAYHYVVDANSITPLCLEEQEPYAQGGANDSLISVCVTGKAGQTPEQWGDEMSHPALLNMALITARIVVAYDIPVQRLRGPELVAGRRGICGHVDVRDAYRQTTHTDPGPFFPWPMMLDLVNQIAYPPPDFIPSEDDMRYRLFSPHGYYDTLAVGPGVPFNPGSPQAAQELVDNNLVNNKDGSPKTPGTSYVDAIVKVTVALWTQMNGGRGPVAPS